MIVTRTPYRISFFGGGTDYPAWYEKNGGAVLSTSIDKYCSIICRPLPPFFEKKHHIVYSKIENTDDVDGIEHPAVRECLRHVGIDHGVSVLHDGDLPARSGMGSSSAFTVGLLHALYAMQGKIVGKRQLAHGAIHVEQQRIKENVGSQDQFAVAFGGLNKLIFNARDIVVEPVVLSGARYQDLQDHCMLFFTGTSRVASVIAGDWIKNTSRNEKTLNTMHGMVDEAIGILADSRVSLREFGKLLDHTWQLKRGISSSVSTPTIDGVYASAKNAGAIGGKLLGAGGGGFILLFVEPSKRPQVQRCMSKFIHVPIQFEGLGSHILHYS